jgi:hypothetical protein
MKRMPDSDIREFNMEMKGTYIYDEICFFLTDDNSSFIGMYVKGDLKGKICILDHDFDLSPAFKSMDSFLSNIEQSDKMWYELEREYPLKSGFTSDEINRDWTIAQNYYEKLSVETDDDLRIYYAHVAACLTSYDHLTRVAELLSDKDFFIQEIACEIIALQGYTPAIGQISDLSKTGLANAKEAARKTLQILNTKKYLS